MQRKWLLLAAGLIAGTIVTGCMERQGDLGNRNIREQGVRYDANGNRIWNKRFADDQMNEMNRLDGRRLNSNNIIGSHANYRMEMSEEISNRLAAMKEIDNACVMLTDYNAYVAVTLRDGTKKGNKGRPTVKNVSPPVPLSRSNQSLYRPGALDDRTIRGRTMNNLNTTNPSSDLASGLKQRIAGEVKRMAPQIKNVFISANPDFVDRMASYMEDVRLGHSIQPYIAEFNAMAERIFPARTGIQHNEAENSKIIR